MAEMCESYDMEVSRKALARDADCVETMSLITNWPYPAKYFSLKT